MYDQVAVRSKVYRSMGSKLCTCK